MFEKPEVVSESQEDIKNLSSLTDEELESHTMNFLGERVIELPQEEIEAKLSPLLTELSRRGIDGFGLFASSLPDSVSADEIETGESTWAKVYKSLLQLSASAAYKEDPALQMTVRKLENIIDQNPQMLGPVAMWETAKDVMWRRDIPAHAKGSLMGSMTYALAFFDTDPYKAELLKNLDFTDTENYAEVAHMLEALKQFWASSHEGYAADRVPEFYVEALREIKETPEANYLLSVRAREILSTLEESEDFPNEVRDIQPFMLSKDTYASTQVAEGLMVIPEENNLDLEEAIEAFRANEAQITPPQWMVDEAIANGESWIYWEPPQDLVEESRRLFGAMHQPATIPIEEKLGALGEMDAEKKEELLFDYEYLVSRPVREMIQREFAFSLQDLSLQEQLYFLNYLKKVSVADADMVKKFTSLYGVDGMRTFLSLERGDETLGDHIVAFGQHDEVAGTVFQYYGELLDSAERAESLVREVSDCEGAACTELATHVRKNILNRAQRDLETAVRAHDPSEIAAQIEQYVAGAKEYVALLQEVGAGDIETVPATELSPEDQERMQTLLRNNYDRAYPEPEHDEFKTAIVASLTKSFSNSETTFRILRDHGEIVSYNRFDTMQDSTGKAVSYFGSFNAHPAYSGVGSIMLEETIKDRLEDGRPMLAHCDPTQSITKKYIEDGFVATSFYELAQQPSFEIWRDTEMTEHFASKEQSIDELLALANDQANESIIVREATATETYLELQRGMGLTRYFTYQGNTYLVFETLPDVLRRKFTFQSAAQEEAA
jgi:hypothetical protein